MTVIKKTMKAAIVLVISAAASYWMTGPAYSLTNAVSGSVLADKSNREHVYPLERGSLNSMADSRKIDMDHTVYDLHESSGLVERDDKNESAAIEKAAHATGAQGNSGICLPSGSLDETLPAIAVSVATLWTKPLINRELDEPSLLNPADPAGWTASMSIKEKLWLVGKLETQALLGQTVQILEEREDWVKVAVIGQSTPRASEGYPGWLLRNQLAESNEAALYANCPSAVVKRPLAWLSEDPEGDKNTVQISFNTRLPVVKSEEASVLVMTPNLGMQWLSRDDVRLVRMEEMKAADGSEAEAHTDETQADGHHPNAVSGRQLVETADMFLGLPYLWAGTSGFGFDCSGFTYSLYRYYGIDIPRDAKDQARFGVKVDPDSLQPGDLLFYAYNKGKGAVHHVAMYAGDGWMIHSPQTERPVERIRVDTPEYAKEFAGARRVIVP